MQKINMQQTEKERDQEGCKSRHGQNEENHLSIDHIGQRLHMSYGIKEKKKKTFVQVDLFHTKNVDSNCFNQSFYESHDKSSCVTGDSLKDSHFTIFVE